MAANPNTFDADFPEWWSKRMQAKHHKNDVFRDFVNMEERQVLEKGDKVNRPRRSDLLVNDMGADGSYSRQALTDTQESLNIDKEKEVAFYIRKIDEIQANYALANEYADDSAVRLGNEIDGDILGEVAQAANTIDDGDIDAGTAGNGITMTESNVLQIIAKASEKLDNEEVAQDGRRSAISPQFKRILKLALQQRDTAFGDKVGVRGRVGEWDGFNMNLSTAIFWTGRLLMATNPINGDTIVINGVTLTFKDTLTTAGDVHICTTAATTIDNLLNVLEAPGTTIAEAAETGYTKVTTANQFLLENINATDNGTSIDLNVTGKSFFAVSETLTAAADVWTPALQIQHNLFCRSQVNAKGLSSGPVDLAIQVKPNMETFHRDGFIGRDVVSWQVYGKKTFNEGTKEMVDVQIRSDGF